MTRRHIQCALQQTAFARLRHFGQRTRAEALRVVLRSDAIHETVVDDETESPNALVQYRSIVEHLDGSVQAKTVEEVPAFSYFN